MKKTILLSAVFVSLILITTVHAEEGRKICSSRLIDSTIDGYRMPNADGSFQGTFKINKPSGSLTISAEGMSDLHEKVILKSDMKISSVVQHDGNYYFEGYAPILTISEGNAKLGLRNVPMWVQWNRGENIVYIGYEHQDLEETAITFKETC